MLLPLIGAAVSLHAAYASYAEPVLIETEPVEKKHNHYQWWLDADAHVRIWYKYQERLRKEAIAKPQIDSAQAKRLRRQAKRRNGLA